MSSRRCSALLCHRPGVLRSLCYTLPLCAGGKGNCCQKKKKKIPKTNKQTNKKITNKNPKKPPHGSPNPGPRLPENEAARPQGTRVPERSGSERSRAVPGAGSCGRRPPRRCPPARPGPRREGPTSHLVSLPSNSRHPALRAFGCETKTAGLGGWKKKKRPKMGRGRNRVLSQVASKRS